MKSNSMSDIVNYTNIVTREYEEQDGLLDFAWMSMWKIHAVMEIIKNWWNWSEEQLKITNHEFNDSEIMQICYRIDSTFSTDIAAETLKIIDSVIMKQNNFSPKTIVKFNRTKANFMRIYKWEVSINISKATEKDKGERNTKNINTTQIIDDGVIEYNPQKAA